MTDVTSHIQMRHEARGRPGTAEYRTYYTVIFAAALMLAVVRWTLLLLRHARLPAKGPLHRARAEADTITPIIFWS